MKAATSTEATPFLVKSLQSVLERGCLDNSRGRGCSPHERVHGAGADSQWGLRFICNSSYLQLSGNYPLNNRSNP